MGWLRRKVGEDPDPDPTRYTRIACEVCDGTGWLMAGGKMYAVDGMRPMCTSCDGSLEQH